MFRPFPRLRALFLATLLCAGAAAQARAADMPGLADLALPTPPDEPVEWGSNWYLRGDVALERARVPALSGDFAALLNSGATFDGRPIGAGDIAVIVEKHRDGRACFTALTDGGIQAVYTGDSDVFESPAAAVVARAMLRVCNELHGSLADVDVGVFDLCEEGGVVCVR